MSQGLIDVRSSFFHVAGHVRLLHRLQAEPEAGFLVPDELFRLLLGRGQEPQRRIDVAVAVGFQGLLPAEPDPFQRRIELQVERWPGRSRQQGGFEAAKHRLELCPFRRIVAERSIG